jgi:hypothetical protein
MWYDEQPCCPSCDDKESALAEAKDFLMPIVQQLYNQAKFDLDHFEFCLDNLCAQLGVKLPDGDLIINQESQTEKMLEAWKKWNKNYLQSLTYTN